MADQIRLHQIVMQSAGVPIHTYSELLPDYDGAKVGSWGVHNAVEYHDAINSKDDDQDDIPNEWPAGPSYMPAYIYLDNPVDNDYIDFRLKAGNGADTRTDHKLLIYTQQLVGAVADCPTYRPKLYQGDPANGGTLVYDYTGSPNFGSGAASPTTIDLDACGEAYESKIPEGYSKLITDYSDLWVRIVIENTHPAGNPIQVAIGRICLRYPAPPRGDEGPGYTSLWISGVDWTDRLLTDSLRITKDLQNRSTMEVRLVDITGTKHLLPGEEVYFYFEDRCLFGGKVETVDEEYPEGHYDDYLIISLRCADWMRLLDRFTVADSWEGATLETIITEMFTYDTKLVDKEGIILGSIPSFTYDGKVNFRREKVSNCLRELLELPGFIAAIHPHTKTLTIYERSTYRAPWTIGDDDQEYRGLRFSRSLDQYRNVQWLVGGKGETAERTEYFHGHPSTDESTRQRTFNLGYPCARVPTVSVKRSGDPDYTVQDVGIRGVDTDGDTSISGWKQWFWSRDQTEITQNSAEDAVNNATLTTDDILMVTYIGLYPLTGYEENQIGISERMEAEGGSGRYENVEEDAKTDSMPLVEERCLRLLEQFGRVPATLRYEVDKDGLEPGMLQSIVIAGHGVNAEYMIEEMTITFLDPELTMIRVSVQALDGERQEGWVDFWRRSQEAGKKLSIREDEVVGIFQTLSDTVEITETFTESVHGSVTIPDWDDDPFSAGIYGEITVSGIRYPKFRYGRSRYAAPIAIP